MRRNRDRERSHDRSDSGKYRRAGGRGCDYQRPRSPPRAETGGASSSGQQNVPERHRLHAELAHLGLNTSGENVTNRLVQVAYRVRSVSEHPDQGGTDDRMKALNASRDALLRAFPA